jgi:hypothetical protein
MANFMSRSIGACEWINTHQEVMSPKERGIKWAEVFYLEDLFYFLDQAMNNANDGAAGLFVTN